MKKLFSEKTLLLVLFVAALALFRVANEDSKKSGLASSPITTRENTLTKLSDDMDNKVLIEAHR